MGVFEIDSGLFLDDFGNGLRSWPSEISVDDGRDGECVVLEVEVVGLMNLSVVGGLSF